MAGIETIKEIRKSNTIPVIMLSAKSEDEDKITGLDLGADDYITKPFNPLELIARVNALIRRYTKFGAIEETTENYYITSLDENRNKAIKKFDKIINSDIINMIASYR